MQQKNLRKKTAALFCLILRKIHKKGGVRTSYSIVTMFYHMLPPLHNEVIDFPIKPEPGRKERPGKHRKKTPKENRTGDIPQCVTLINSIIAYVFIKIVPSFSHVYSLAYIAIIKAARAASLSLYAWLRSTQNSDIMFSICSLPLFM